MKGIKLGTGMDIARPERQSQKSSLGITDKKGDLKTAHNTIPKGDFSHFLGYKKPTQQELSGQTKLSGSRTIQVALQQEFKKVGKGAMERGNQYRNLYVSHSNVAKTKGPGQAMVKDGLHSITQATETNAALNMRYLEVQYKFQLANRNFSAISNVMKVRHESIKKSMSDIR
jgi:hypothetical protein